MPRPELLGHHHNRSELMIVNQYRDRLTRPGSDIAHPGRVLEMGNGDRWFHPDTGAEPFKLPNRQEKTS